MSAEPLPWIVRAPDAPYFMTEAGAPWAPIGQNDAITWPEFNGLFRGRDPAPAEHYVRHLRAHGVTCLRLMLEYTQREHRYLERPIGSFVPNMVRLWDDLFAVCRANGMRVLLTPFDTFFLWRRFKHHPLNRANGGPCASRRETLTCPGTRAVVKARLAFATERWGGDGLIFGWDLWNEMHPAQGGDDPRCFWDFISDVGADLRAREQALHGRTHLQCVSVFGPELGWKEGLTDPIFRHPGLDFANSHFYEEGTIDDPRDTVVPALAVGRLVREALAEITDGRPFHDSEHGPIHTFKDRHVVLPEPFDDEYFRHIQWAHLASGGAGGGMRWPNRHPHSLTAGMRRAQRALAEFLPLVDWARFRRRNLNDELELDDAAGVAACGCGDADQAVLWLVRRGPFRRGGRLAAAPPRTVTVRIPTIAPGPCRAICWDTRSGREIGARRATATTDGVSLTVTLDSGDLAVAVRRDGAG